MRTIEAADGHVVIQLHPDDDVLSSINSAIDEHGIDAGTVLSGIGSLKVLRTSTIVEYESFPDVPSPGEEATREIHSEMPWEVGSLQGAIVDSEPHLHIMVYNAEEDRTVAGHLHEGSITETLMEIVVQPIKGIDATRQLEEDGVPRISPRDK
ncbi:PPC domain-containing DNA-binding protein (plasmid) [Haloferax prahovense]|jgi:predicted DNA-binding protein with PD1-like motif|uniref:PPC domain-containing DNA-binding protein n=1 Tax=Haloferax prahovense TaxID=381852 RepID=UPI003C728BE1